MGRSSRTIRRPQASRRPAEQRRQLSRVSQNRAYPTLGPVPGIPSAPLLVTRAQLTFAYPNVTTSTIADTFSSNEIQISSFADSAQYLALFDQYKIEKVEMWLEPLAAQGTTVFGYFVSCVDYDDANTPTSRQQVEAKQTSVATTSGSAHYHVWQPHVAVAGYSGTFAGFLNAPSPWVDSASNNIQHYGLKFAFGPTPVAVTYAVRARIHAAFRAPGL